VRARYYAHGVCGSAAPAACCTRLARVSARCHGSLRMRARCARTRAAGWRSEAVLAAPGRPHAIESRCKLVAL